MSGENKTADDVLKKLVISEEETIAQLETFVILARPFIRIKKEIAEIEFPTSCALSLKEKSALFLIGKYFAKKLNFHNQEVFSIQEIALALDTVRTTISGKIAELVREKVIIKVQKNQYKANYSQIQGFLEALNKKYKAN